MADRFLLLAHRQVVLRVARVEVLRILQVEALVPLADAERLAEEVDRAVGVELLELALEDRRLLAAPIEHRLRQLEVALLAGGARELDERQLDAFVSGDVVLLARTELAVEDVGHPRRDREQRLLARRLVVRDAGLEQVAGREVLVEEREVLELQVRHVDLDEGVQVPVRLLGGGDARR